VIVGSDYQDPEGLHAAPGTRTGRSLPVAVPLACRP
jgi:hypothetical protein